MQFLQFEFSPEQTKLGEFPRVLKVSTLRVCFAQPKNQFVTTPDKYNKDADVDKVSNFVSCYS